MSITSQPRKRLSPEDSRAAALEAARDLLLTSGPQAVTLKAVAGRIGRTHANLLHHFGSAAELQSALAGMISDRVTGSIAEAVERARQGTSDSREIIDLTFDALDRFGDAARDPVRDHRRERRLKPGRRAEMMEQIGMGAADPPGDGLERDCLRT